MIQKAEHEKEFPPSISMVGRASELKTEPRKWAHLFVVVTESYGLKPPRVAVKIAVQAIGGSKQLFRIKRCGML